MSRPARARPRATIADLLALPEGTRFHEVIAGDLVQKAAPTGEHGAAQAALAGSLFGSFSRPPGGRFPGGWWFETEVEIQFETHEIYRPDVVGRRRDRAAATGRHAHHAAPRLDLRDPLSLQRQG